MVNILVAPAAYKGSIPASSLAKAMAQAARNFFAERKLDAELVITEAPIADGGDDTVLCLHEALGGNLIRHQVTGPTGQTIEAAYLRLTDMAIVELAWPSGIAHLTNAGLDALNAHTFGLGQLIGHAIAGGAKRIVITLGGSASTDGGTGALAALGVGFLDGRGQPISLGGGGLAELVSLDLTKFVAARSAVEFIIATDVTSPLLGPLGAAHVFAPQKGASPGQVQILESNLAHFAAVLGDFAGATGQQCRAAGAGAAGGAGFGLATLLPAKIVSGFHFFAELLDLKSRIEACNLLVVAEGCLDTQSLAGKGVGEIIALARAHGKDILAVPALCALDKETIASMGGTNKFIVVDAASLSQESLAGLKEVGLATKQGLARWLDGQ